MVLRLDKREWCGLGCLGCWAFRARSGLGFPGIRGPEVAAQDQGQWFECFEFRDGPIL